MSDEKLWDESPTSRHLQVLYHQTSFQVTKFLYQAVDLPTFDSSIFTENESLILIKVIVTSHDFGTDYTNPNYADHPRVNMHWIHCIEYISYQSGFLSNSALALENRVHPENFHCIEIFFLPSGFLRLPWKTECALNSLYWIYIFCHSRHLSKLRLLWKTEFALKFFTVLIYLSSFRIFEQVALALKTEFALKIFKPGGWSPPRPPASYAYALLRVNQAKEFVVVCVWNAPDKSLWLCCR